jgi:hypothetical protein
MGAKNTNKREMTKKLVAGREYYILEFDSGNYMIMLGVLNKNDNNSIDSSYVFSAPNRGFYRVFPKDDIKRAKVGQAVRREIRNGRLQFTAFFENEKEANTSIHKIAKNVASFLIRESIEKDKQVIIKIKGEVMDRISIFKDVVSSKTMSDLTASIKKLHSET